AADLSAWSRIVLTQRTQTVVRLTQAGPGATPVSTPVSSTTSYGYQLSYPLAAGCGDSTATFYWGSCFDQDYLDYFNYRFMGFAQATVVAQEHAGSVHT